MSKRSAVNNASKKGVARRSLSKTLTIPLHKIRDSPIEFNPIDQRFELHVDGTDEEDAQCLIKPGLTKILRSVFPVPYSADDPRPLTKSGKVSRRKAFRASGKDPTPAPNVWRCSAGTLPIPVAHSCKLATMYCRLSQLDDTCGTSGFGPNFNRRHGILVDEQLKLYVARGRASLLPMKNKEATKRSEQHIGILAGGVDPCTGALLAYFKEMHLRPIAAQVPLYSPEMNVATSIDVILTDDATLSELHVFEIKSSTYDGVDDSKYVQLRGRLKSSVARGTPLSYYSQHQLQLWVQNHMIVSTIGCAPHSAAVVRVASGTVRTYHLNNWYRERSKKLIPAIRKRTQGSYKSASRKRRKQRVNKMYPGSINRRVMARLSK